MFFHNNEYFVPDKQIGDPRMHWAVGVQDGHRQSTKVSKWIEIV